MYRRIFIVVLFVLFLTGCKNEKNYERKVDADKKLVIESHQLLNDEIEPEEKGIDGLMNNAKADTFYVEELVKYYNRCLTKAVNNNDFNIIKELLYDNREIYNEHKKFIEDTNALGITLEFIDSNCEDLEILDDVYIYKELVSYKYIYKDNKKEEEKTFNKVFTICYEDGEYYIKKIDINKIEENKGEKHMYSLDEIKDFICKSEDILDNTKSSLFESEEGDYLGFVEDESNPILKLKSPYDNPQVLIDILSEHFSNNALDYILFLKHILKVNDVYGSYGYSEDDHWFFDKDKEFIIVSQDENNISIKVPFTDDHGEINYAQYEIENKNGLLKIIKISFPEYGDKYESYKEYIKENAVFY